MTGGDVSSRNGVGREMFLFLDINNWIVNIIIIIIRLLHLHTGLHCWKWKLVKMFGSGFGSSFFGP